MSARKKQTTLDIVIPVFNEQPVLRAFHEQLASAVSALPYEISILYINDGSTDGSGEILEDLQKTDPRVKVIELSRNFGHQAALTAGLDASRADYVISMDGDGQHPAAMIPEMLRQAEAGYDVVLTQRLDEPSTSAFKRETSALFYRLINLIGNTRIVPGAADFRLLSRPVVTALRSMHEYHRFLRGMVAWAGYKTVILPFQPPQRLGGESKYNLRKMVNLSLDAVFSFSLVPLYIGLSLGGLMLVLALAEMIYVLSFWVTGSEAHLVPGWSSMMFVLLVIGGFLMVSLGFIGIYVGYIFQEVKRRPIYLTRSGRSPTAVQDAEPEPASRNGS